MAFTKKVQACCEFKDEISQYSKIFILK